MKTLEASNEHEVVSQFYPNPHLHRRFLIWVASFLFLVSGLGLPSWGQAQASSVGSLSTPVDKTASPQCDGEYAANLPKPSYLVLLRAGGGSETWKTFSTWDALANAAEQGSLFDIETYVEDGSRFYAGIWRAGAGGEELTRSTNLPTFNATRATKQQNGLGLIDLEVVKIGDNVDYLAVWKPGAAAIELLTANSAGSFESQAEAMLSTHVLLDVDSWYAAGERIFIGVFRPRLPSDGLQMIRVAQSWCDFHGDYHALEPTYRLEDLEFHVDAEGERRYTAFWSEGSAADHLWIGYSREGFDMRHQDLLQEASQLRFHDVEIAGDPVMFIADLQGDGHRKRTRFGRRAQDRNRADGPRRKKTQGSSSRPSGSDPGWITDKKDDDGGVIVGAPVLHDTGSSGPD